MFSTIWEVILELFSGEFNTARLVFNSVWLNNHLWYFILMSIFILIIMLLIYTVNIQREINKMNIESRRFDRDLMRSRLELEKSKEQLKNKNNEN